MDIWWTDEHWWNMIEMVEIDWNGEDSRQRGTWDVGCQWKCRSWPDPTGHNRTQLLLDPLDMDGLMGSVHSNILPQGSWPIACSRRLWKLDRLLPEIQYESYWQKFPKSKRCILSCGPFCLGQRLALSLSWTFGMAMERESNDRGIINLNFSYNPIIYNVRHVLEIERHLEWNHW